MTSGAASVAQEARYQLVIIRGPSAGKSFRLEPGANLIGRWDPDKGSFPEVDLDSDDIDAKVSRKHAIIEVSEDGTTLEDVGSLNGTFINRGDRIESSVKHRLRVGDEIVVGKIFLRFETAEAG